MSKKGLNYDKNFTFSVIDNKFVWFNFNEKAVWHFDLDNIQNKNENFVNWKNVSCKGFIIKDFVEDLTRETYIKNGISISEIRLTSVIRMKKVKEK